jgi:HK97 family phage portal protein
MANNKPGLWRRLRSAIVSPGPDVVQSFDNRSTEAANRLSMSMTSESGTLVNARSAMSLDAVWSCVRLIAESIAMAPLSLYVRDERNPRIATRHPLNDLLHTSPNSRSTAAVFWEAVVSAMLLQGNAYILKFYSGTQISSLVFMAPNRLNVVKDLQGNKKYLYVHDDGVQREVPANRVWQLQGFSLDGRDGVSVIEYATQVFGTAIAAERSAGRTFINGMLQAVYYSVSAFLTDEQRESFRRNVRGTVERGEAPILEGGVDVKALGINPADAQLLESRGYSVEAICRWFRVPPSMVGHDGKTTSWGTGIEQQVLGFITFTLTPWLVRIEQGIAHGLLTDVERTKYYPKFDVDYLLRGDSEARANYYQSMVNNGNMTRDEVRRKEGLPLKGGNADILTVQSAMMALDGLSLAPVSSDPPSLESANAALRAFLANSNSTGEQH